MYRSVQRPTTPLTGRGELPDSHLGVGVSPRTFQAFTLRHLAGTLAYMSPEQVAGLPPGNALRS